MTNPIPRYNPECEEDQNLASEPVTGLAVADPLAPVTVERGEEDGEANRYIRFRCPLCVIKGIESTSPVCDQREDVRRHKPREWWVTHLEQSHPYPPPIIERANPVPLGAEEGGSR